jgi:selenocysteine-specific elongation factor
VKELLESGKLVWLESADAGAAEARLVIAEAHWRDVREKADRALSSYHGKFPLRRGIPREELKSRLELSPRAFNALVGKLVEHQELVEFGNALAKSGHTIRLDADQQARAHALLRKFEQHPFAPPTLKESRAEAGEELINALIELGGLAPVSDDIIFRKQDYDSMVARVRATLAEKGQITLAEVRDLFNTSRKYAQALLEYLDATGVTRRDGDYRRLK